MNVHQEFLRCQFASFLMSEYSVLCLNVPHDWITGTTVCTSCVHGDNAHDEEVDTEDTDDDPLERKGYLVFGYNVPSMVVFFIASLISPS